RWPRPRPGGIRRNTKNPRRCGGRTARGGSSCSTAPPDALACGPVARRHEERGEALLRRARRRLPVVAPFHDRRQRHEDRLAAPARLQAEERAAVPDEVELDVAPAAIRLEVALPLAVGGVATALEDRRVRGQEGIAHRAHDLEALRESAFAEIVEEGSPD